MARPSFVNAWTAFMVVNLPVSEVGKKIGGNVQKNIDENIFQNACPIRISYALNSTGFPVVRGAGYETVSGGDGRQYIFRVNDMMEYLQRVFGKPDKTVRAPKSANFGCHERNYRDHWVWLV